MPDPAAGETAGAGQQDLLRRATQAMMSRYVEYSLSHYPHPFRRWHAAVVLVTGFSPSS